MLKVISFNIRFCNDPDGHSIAERAPRLAALVTPLCADIIGLQEWTPTWDPYIQKTFGEQYEIFGKTRAADEKEGTPILWRKDKFDCVKRGHFWLSDTPEVESKGWDERCHCHRICLYVVLKDKQTGRLFTYMNTHFGFGDDGQRKSAALLYDYSRRISDYPTVITGDFNMTPTMVAYGEMTAHFTDVNAVTANDLRDTYHAYNPSVYRDQHIDYCFVTADIKAVSQRILDTDFDGKYPSDHFGIEMELEL